MVERRGDGDFHAELIGLVRFTLGHAFDLQRVQGIDFLAARPLLLMTHRVGQRQHLRKSRLPVRIAGDLAPDVAHHAAEIGAQCLQRPVDAPELFGVSVELIRASFSRVRCMSLASVGNATALSTIWSSCDLNKSFFPLSRRTFGSIVISPSQTLPKTWKHADSAKSNCKKIDVDTPKSAIPNTCDVAPSVKSSLK